MQTFCPFQLKEFDNYLSIFHLIVVQTLVLDSMRRFYYLVRLNHCVMKWIEGAKEGIVVASGRGQGDGLAQLSNPFGVVVDQLGTVYVTDEQNHRIMRWFK